MFSNTTSEGSSPEETVSRSMTDQAMNPETAIKGEMEETSALRLITLVLRYRNILLGTPILAAAAAAVVSLAVHPQYTATASFVPEAQNEGPSLPSGIAGIASQFGLTLPGGNQSSSFYAAVLTGRTLLDQVLSSKMADPRPSAPINSTPLLDILEVAGDSIAERMEEGRKRLLNMVDISVARETEITKISVQSQYPSLSADIANRFLERLDSFNLETRQSTAGERRRFVESRITAAEDELESYEDSLRMFLEQNRDFSGSPALQFQHDRLQRKVSIRQEVLTTLRREHEQARIQEVNDTPVITVVDRAVRPHEKSSPHRKLNVILAFFVGGVIALCYAVIHDFANRSARANPAQFQEVSVEWETAVRELRHRVGSMSHRLRRK